ncbi:MAG: mechanosensitive ion channel family protein [Candidatus Obscuribacterales bacterium]|nr:mechanosensitive ion channel family protein [Candidatus Obscuribacterales bacterium]
MLKRIFLTVVANYRKLLPTVVLITLAVLALGTDVFSQDVHETIRAVFTDYLVKLKPFAMDLLLAAILVNFAWLFYKPVTTGFEKVLEKTSASERGKDLSTKLFKFFYWAIVVFLVLSLTAAEFLSRFVVGFGVFGAALTLSLQGAANDFVCGLFIQITRKVNDNEQIKLEGVDVKGKVVSIGSLSTIVDTETDVVHVPNREIWARAVKVAKPSKSPIILPPGFDSSNGKNS